MPLASLMIQLSNLDMGKAVERSRRRKPCSPVDVSGSWKIQTTSFQASASMRNADITQRPYYINIPSIRDHDFRRERHWKRELSVVATSHLLNHHLMRKTWPLPRFRRSRFSTRTRHLAIICAYHLHRKSKLSVK